MLCNEAIKKQITRLLEIGVFKYVNRGNYKRIQTSSVEDLCSQCKNQAQKLKSTKQDLLHEVKRQIKRIHHLYIKNSKATEHKDTHIYIRNMNLKYET